MKLLKNGTKVKIKNNSFFGGATGEVIGHNENYNVIAVNGTTLNKNNNELIVKK